MLRFSLKIIILSVESLLVFGGGNAFAQGPEFFDAAPPANSDLDAQEGLESATPTDNVNELGGNVSGGNGAEAPINDFPAGENSNDFDIDSSDSSMQGTSDNSLFNDAPVDLGNGAAKPTNNANSAFGNNAPLKNNAAPVNSVPAAAPVLNNAVPANAETLLNQISNDAQSAPALNSSTPVATPITEAKGDEQLAPTVATPSIKAPPLPPPNEFSGAPPVPGTMRLMADGEAPEEYKVEPGDTLFDICDQMLDEAGYWPKLWALNPEIKNPHFIFPNMRLKFYPGDDETPPYLQVVSEDDVIPIDKGDLDEQELIAEKVIFPSEEFGEGQLTEVIGASQVEEALSDSFLTSGKRYEGTQVSVQVPGFIFANEKDAAGFVIGGRSGEVNLSESQKAIVESVDGLAAGTLYTVVRKGEKIISPDSGDFVGYKYYFVANMRVDKAVEDGIFTATVQNSRLGVQPDDLLISFISTNRTVPTDQGIGTLASVSANIVGFEYDGQEIGGAGSFAFLDKGNGDGVSPGMYVSVYATPGYLTTAFGSSALPVDYEYVGVVRIIDATDAGAVGYVVRNVKELRVGDRTTGKG